LTDGLTHAPFISFNERKKVKKKKVNLKPQLMPSSAHMYVVNPQVFGFSLLLFLQFFTK